MKTDSDMIDLSIIIPVHNVAAYLPRCVESIAAQTFSGSKEVVLVENGSTDNSLEVCKSLAREYDFVRVAVCPQTGLSVARNYGILQAKGMLVGLIDADDFIDPEMFEQLIEAKNSTGSDTAYCNFVLEYIDGKLESPFPNTGNIEKRVPEDVVYDTIMEKSTSSPCVRIYDRSFFDTRKFPEGVKYEDHATLYRWMSEMGSIVHVDKPFYHYCLREGSITQTMKGNKANIRDYFNADIDRIPFVNEYLPLTAVRRKQLLKHIVRQVLMHLKDYIRALGKGCADDTGIRAMRDAILLHAGSLGIGTLGFELWLKIKRIRWNWHGYYNRYA